jgi:RimJ/RimL family protein N-acetyltransferase
MKLGSVPLEGRFVTLQPLAQAHKEPLRAACEADQDIWEIYPYSMAGEHFDHWWDQTLSAESDWNLFAALADGECVGVTGFAPEPKPGIVVVGGTYFRPQSRGGPVNPESKLLLLDHAFAARARRAVFNVDVVNPRSHAAMLKLGATAEGVTRQASITWTGRVRDLTVFSILADEWPAVRPRIEARLAEFSSRQGT